MWNDHESDAELLSTWIKHSPSMKLAKAPEGTIYWANEAFCEWSGYTLAELRKMTWMQLSVADESLAADVAEMKSLDSYKTSYTVRKQYIPKNDKPQWGKLTVIRYPATGDIKVLLCEWMPLQNGTAEAFRLAMESVGKLKDQVSEMAGQLKGLQEQTDVDRWVLSTVRLAQKYPKVAAAVFTTAILIVLGNNGIGFLQRIGLLPLPSIHTDAASAEERRADAEAVGQVFHADGIVNPRPSLTMHYGDRMRVEWSPPDQPEIFEKGKSL